MQSAYCSEKKQNKIANQLSVKKLYFYEKIKKITRPQNFTEAASYLESIAMGVTPSDLTVIAMARPGISLSNIDLVAYQKQKQHYGTS
jgi:outer membrane protein assembly factor BamD (BamD/ComL family)